MNDSYTFATTQGRDQAPPTPPHWEARTDDSYTFENTPGKDQAPPTAPLWEARMDDSYTFERTQEEGSCTSYTTALGGQNGRQ